MVKSFKWEKGWVFECFSLDSKPIFEAKLVREYNSLQTHFCFPLASALNVLRFFSRGPEM